MSAPIKRLTFDQLLREAAKAVDAVQDAERFIDAEKAMRRVWRIERELRRPERVTERQPPVARAARGGATGG